MGIQKNERAPSVFDADDYRTFLRDYYQYRKARNRQFSYQAFSNLLGLKSRSHLQLLIAKKRNLGIETLEKFAVLFPGRPKEFRHFKTLVMFEQTASKTERADLAGEILKHKNRKNVTSIKFEWYELYSDWYYFPILFMPDLPGFEPSAEWIRRALLFPVGIAEVRAAKNKFAKLGLWRTRPDGSIEIVHEVLQTAQEWDRDSLRDYHKGILALASKAVGSLPREERYVSGSTLKLSRQRFEEMAREYHELKQSLFQKYSEPAQEAGQATDLSLYQVSISIFPYTNAEHS